MKQMDLFQPRTRNELLQVCLHLTYDEIKTLFLLNQSCFQFMKQFVQENYLLLKPIVNKRFFDRGQTRIYKIDSLDYSFSWKANYDSYHGMYTDRISNWKHLIVDLDYGDMIWLHRINRFVVIQNKDQLFYVQDRFDPMTQDLQFPKFYWKQFAEIAPYRVWVKGILDQKNLYVSYIKKQENEQGKEEENYRIITYEVT